MKISPATVEDIVNEQASDQPGQSTVLQKHGTKKTMKLPSKKDNTRTQTFVVHDIEELQKNHPIINQQYINDEPAIETENQRMVHKANKRRQLYREILTNNYFAFSTPYYKGLFAFIGVVAGILMTLPMALIPTHDTIEYPQYFYEYTLIMIFTGPAGPVYAVILLWEFSYIIKMDHLRNFKNCARVTLGLIVSALSIRGMIYFIWVHAGGYRFPMPFNATLTTIIEFLPIFTILWFQCPRNWRLNKKFQRRFWYYVSIKLINILIYLEYQFIFKTAFLIVSPDWQWVVCIALPIAREINLRVQMKLSYKASGSKDDSVELYREHYVGTQHCLFLSAAMGSDITTVSTIILIGTDAILNVCLTLKLILMKHKNMIEENIEEARELLSSLIVNEVVELVVALTFLISLLLSYNGANATLMGNIKSSHFHNKPIEDIESFVTTLLYFVVIDVFCILVTGLALWIFSGINVLRANAFIQQEFWVLMATNTAYWIHLHFNSPHVSNASDFTFKFEWLEEHNKTGILPNNGAILI